jgi:ribosomal protein S27AE
MFKLLKFVCIHCGSDDAHVREHLRAPMLVKQYIAVSTDGQCWKGNNALSEYDIDDTSTQVPKVEFFCSNCGRPILARPMDVKEGRKALFEFLKTLPCNQKE